MPGLFGFFVRTPRPRAWMEATLEQMRRLMVSGPDHHVHSEIHPHAAFGHIGRGAADGTTRSHLLDSGSVMLADGEAWRAGSWGEVHARWLHGGAAAMRDVDGLYSLIRYDPGGAAGPGLRIITDRYGDRRLFLHEHEDGVAFAADFQPLAAWLGDHLEIDRAYLDETVCLGTPLARRTWARQIRWFPPATELIATPAGVHLTRYWNWSSLPPPGTHRPADVPGETYERWRDVIAPRLAGDRVGQQLSGGLDSRLILAEAAHVRREWSTLTYGEPGSDEVRFAARASATAGARWTLLELPAPDWLAVRVAASIAHGGMIDLLNSHHARRFEEVRRAFDIELSGFAGDVTLGTTYVGLTPATAVEQLPWWDSPVSLPFAEARGRVAADIGSGDTWGWMMDTKLRQAINWWPHLAAGDIVVRKPFLDYAFLEYCAGLPIEWRQESRIHTAILRRHFPRLARVPIQRTGVPPGAPRLVWLAMATRRRAHRLARHAGLPLRPWLRGAVDITAWLDAADVRRQITDTICDPGARLATYFDPAALRRTLATRYDEHRIANEVVLNLYRIEQVLRALPRWQRGTP